MTTVYLDCFGGVAGDMLLAALIDAGASPDVVRADVAEVVVGGWDLDVTPVTKAGVGALQVRVHSTEPSRPRRHSELVAMIEGSALSKAVKKRSISTFRLLAEAEAAVHRTSIEETHFHEVGAIDAVVDIVGCASALEQLGARRVVSSQLPLGRGRTSAAHGTLPLPAPAVTELLKGVPVVAGPDHETVTPTGAAIVVAAASSFGSIPSMQISSVGWGAGHRDTESPNVMRVIVGTSSASADPIEMIIISANIDDMSPEMLPHAIEALMSAGAQDAWITPIIMKKGRPAFLVSALVTDATKDAVVDTLYRETTTLGLRFQRVGKDELAREWREVSVEGHPVRIKIGRRGPEAITHSPEHADAVRVAKATGMPLKDVYRAALEALARAVVD